MNWSRTWKCTALIALLMVSMGGDSAQARGWRSGGWGRGGYGNSYYGNGNGISIGFGRSNYGGYGRSYYGNSYGNSYGRGYSNRGWGQQHYYSPNGGGYGHYQQGGYYVQPQYYNAVSPQQETQCPGSGVQTPEYQYSSIESACCQPLVASCCPSSSSPEQGLTPTNPAVASSPAAQPMETPAQASAETKVETPIARTGN
jgi:hypothetical protein